MTILTLTTREIYDLATVAGIQTPPLEELNIDDLETQFTVEPCPKLGLIDEESGCNLMYNNIVYISEYPENGSFGLGDAKNCPESDLF